jgi:hypothetical protein
VVAAVAAVLAIAGAVLVVLLVTGKGTDEASAQTVRFERPTEPGPKPFTNPADVGGKDKVQIGSGPFGGTGSDLVCDRELLIRSLKARPDRLREWARIRGIEPTYAAVARYIRKLKPVTLTRDTRVTNYTYEDGRAVGFQAILQAGTAVLVDRYGEIVARCRCGNPLTKPIYIPTAECIGCPPNYRPPPPCDPYSECYRRYPNPPPVKGCCGRRPEPTRPSGQAAGTPTASFSPASGPPETVFTLSVSGFGSNRSLFIRVTRPSGTVDNFSMSTGADGSGQRQFPSNSSREIGAYSVTVSDPTSGASATAGVTVTSPSGGQQTETETETQTEKTETETETQTETTGSADEQLPVCDPVDPVEPCRPG